MKRMNLVKATISMSDEMFDEIEFDSLNNLCRNIKEYIEEAIEDLAIVQWDKDLKVTFEK